MWAVHNAVQTVLASSNLTLGCVGGGSMSGGALHKRRFVAPSPPPTPQPPHRCRWVFGPAAATTVGHAPVWPLLRPPQMIVSTYDTEPDAETLEQLENEAGVVYDPTLLPGWHQGLVTGWNDPKAFGWIMPLKVCLCTGDQERPVRRPWPPRARPWGRSRNSRVRRLYIGTVIHATVFLFDASWDIKDAVSYTSYAPLIPHSPRHCSHTKLVPPILYR